MEGEDDLHDCSMICTHAHLLPRLRELRLHLLRCRPAQLHLGAPRVWPELKQQLQVCYAVELVLQLGVGVVKGRPPRCHFPALGLRVFESRARVPSTCSKSRAGFKQGGA